MENPMVWPTHILIIAAESSERNGLQRVFSQCGVRCRCCSTLADALALLSNQPVSAVFTEDRLPDGDLPDILRAVGQLQEGLPVVALSRQADWDSYLADMAAGAFDYLAFPSGTLEARRVLWSALQEFSVAQHRQPTTK
jgi:DNA-binding NtrC family response regulator